MNAAARRTSTAAVAMVALIVGAACTSEPATPVDLRADPTSSTTMPPAADPDDINEQSQAKVIELARQQCLDDPDQAEGVVQIVDPGTDEVVNEYRVDCDTVRNEQD